LAAMSVPAAISRAAAVNPLFALATGPPDSAGWLPASDLDAGKLIAEVGHGLGNPPPRVAASMVVLGYSARLVVGPPRGTDTGGAVVRPFAAGCRTR
jgi:hypothetical protein